MMHIPNLLLCVTIPKIEINYILDHLFNTSRCLIYLCLRKRSGSEDIDPRTLLRFPSLNTEPMEDLHLRKSSLA